MHLVPHAARRAGVLLAAVAAVALAGCSGGGAVAVGEPTPTAVASAATSGATSGAASGAASASSPGPAGGSSSAPPGAASPAAGTGPAAGAGKPALAVTLTRTSAAGARAVTVSALVAGVVPQVVDGTGVPLTAAQTEVMGTHVTWGDGGEDGSDPGDVTCGTSGATVPLNQTFDLQHAYTAPGTYTLSFTAGACPPLKDVTRTLSITVR